MSPKETEHGQSQDGLPSTSPKTNHLTIILQLLEAILKEVEMVKHLNNDLEFFRKQLATSLKYDSGAGNYLEDLSDGTQWDTRGESGIGDGTIKESTAVDYLGYKAALEHFQMGFEKTKNQIETIWKEVGVGKDSLTVPDWAAAKLEESRKIAAQE
ncbi:hypothetical protein NX059_001315 [Plenodomus lindquistii]|nr:hypothetical protein NX059_001315 [Plenodomus lindquistii]